MDIIHLEPEHLGLNFGDELRDKQSHIIQHMFFKSPQRCTIIMFSFHITGCRLKLLIMLVQYVHFTARCTTCNDLNAYSSVFSQGNMPPTSTYIKSHNLRMCEAGLLDIMFNILYVPLSILHFPHIFLSFFVSVSLCGQYSDFISSLLAPGHLHLSPPRCMTIQ